MAGAEREAEAAEKEAESAEKAEEEREEEREEEKAAEKAAEEEEVEKAGTPTQQSDQGSIAHDGGIAGGAGEADGTAADGMEEEQAAPAPVAVPPGGNNDTAGGSAISSSYPTGEKGAGGTEKGEERPQGSEEGELDAAAEESEEGGGRAAKEEGAARALGLAGWCSEEESLVGDSEMGSVDARGEDGRSSSEVCGGQKPSPPGNAGAGEGLERARSGEEPERSNKSGGWGGSGGTGGGLERSKSADGGRPLEVADARHWLTVRRGQVGTPPAGAPPGPRGPLRPQMFGEGPPPPRRVLGGAGGGPEWDAPPHLEREWSGGPPPARGYTGPPPH
eukprot:535298-Prorocentrum_minimum.AAC.1